MKKAMDSFAGGAGETGRAGSALLNGEQKSVGRLGQAVEWLLVALVGADRVQGWRASDSGWLTGQPHEPPIPEYSSLAQRAGGLGAGGAGVAAMEPRLLRAVAWPDLPAPPPPPLGDELRAFVAPALRTAGIALAAALLIWGAGSLPVGSAARRAQVPAQLPEDRTFTAEALLPAQGRDQRAAAAAVQARVAELQIEIPAMQGAAAGTGEMVATPAAAGTVAGEPSAVAAPPAPEADAQAVAIAAGAQASSGEVPAWPFSLEIVTPTPNSEAERRLFAEPLVAQRGSEGVALAPPAGDLQQPVLIRSLEAERNGGLPVAAPSLADLALPNVLPAIAFAPVLGNVTPQPTLAPEPTLAPIVLAPGRQWSTFLPGGEATHFWVGRPHPAAVANQIAAPSYQFGSTAGGRYRVHHGMDIANTTGTPVRAAVTGEVVHAGPDDVEVLGPYPNFYGNAVVIRLDRRLTVAGGEMDVYLLYGHMSSVSVQKGQRVQPDDIVGTVGMTGIAIGPHLHVEMRVGANVYEASVNPYLWVEPPPGDGAVAVRLLTADGRTWPGARLTLAAFSGNVATWARVIETYPDNESVNPNPSFGENGAMEAVPAGTYIVVGTVNGERVAAEVSVEAGRTSFVELRTQQ